MTEVEMKSENVAQNPMIDPAKTETSVDSFRGFAFVWTCEPKTMRRLLDHSGVELLTEHMQIDDGEIHSVYSKMPAEIAEDVVESAERGHEICS